MMTLWIVLFSGKLRNAWEYGNDLRTCKTICNLDLELTPRTTVYFVDVVQLPHSPVSVRVHTHKHAQTLASATVISQEDTSFPSCWEAGLYVCWVVTLLPVQQDIIEIPQQQTGPECKQSFEDSGNHWELKDDQGSFHSYTSSNSCWEAGVFQLEELPAGCDARTQFHSSLA